MKTNPVLLTPAVLLVSAALAQSDPGKAPPAAAPHAGPSLQSLQSLATEVVYTRQPLAADAGAPAAGSSADVAFAAIQDAGFDADGRLVSLVVAATGDAAKNDRTRRVLPAKAVKWDPGSRRWLTTEVTMTWAELTEFAPPASKKQPAAAAGPVRWASELFAATIAPPNSKIAEPAIEASHGKDKPKHCVFWLAPEQQMLAFAVVPHGDKCLPIPWALVRSEGAGDKLMLRVDANAAQLDDAPSCASATEPPSAELRQRCYSHFGAAVPKWDRTHDKADKDKSKDKSAEEVGRR